MDEELQEIIISKITTAMQITNNFQSELQIEGNPFMIEFDKENKNGIKFEVLGQDHNIGIYLPSFIVKELYNDTTLYFDDVMKNIITYLTQQIQLLNRFVNDYSGDYNN